MDLHGNELTSIKAPPPGALVAADFSANGVVEIAAEWFEQLYQLALEETGLRGEAMAPFGGPRPGGELLSRRGAVENRWGGERLGCWLGRSLGL